MLLPPAPQDDSAHDSDDFDGAPAWTKAAGSFGNPLKNPLKKADPEPAPSESAPEEREAPEPAARTLFDEYRMQEGDMGFTASEIKARLAEEPAEMSALEERVLDALLFQMHYEHTFTIGKKCSFTLRTIGAESLHNTATVALRHTAQTPELKGQTTVALENAIAVARTLVEYNGTRVGSQNDHHGFESADAIEERLKFVLTLPLAVVNMIGDRSNALFNIVRSAVRRETSNFF